jgi:hypothetical protein
MRELEQRDDAIGSASTHCSVEAEAAAPLATGGASAMDDEE